MIEFRMNIHHVLFFCFASALCGGNTRLVSAKLTIFTGAEGGNGSIDCHLTLSGSRKFICKDECKVEDILIKVDGDRAQSGRFSVKYRNESSGRGIVTVTITNLTESDEGWYRCGLGRTLVPDLFCDFEVRVSDAALFDGKYRFIRSDTEGENITFPCSDMVYRRRKFLCKDECKKEDVLIETDQDRAENGRYSIEYIKGSLFGLYVTITQATRSDTGWYKCGYGNASSPESYLRKLIIVDHAPTTPKPNWTLRPFSTSVPSASTQAPTQSVSSSSGSSVPPSALPETTQQSTVFSLVPHPDYFLPLVVCVSLAGVLLLVFCLLILYMRKTKRIFTPNRGHIEFPILYKYLASSSTCEDSTNRTSRD